MASNFQNPERHLPAADAPTLGSLVSAASDLTLVIDGGDVIEDLSHSLDRSASFGIPAWRGRKVEDVVRASSRPTLKKMISSARVGKPPVRFDVNHLLVGDRDLPIQYSAMSIGSNGQLVLMGRDLRPVAELQSRLLANRQSLEQNVRHQRQLEAHYRLLFETGSDAVVIVEAPGGKIREANPRAAAMLGSTSANLAGKRLTALFERSVQADVQSLLSRAADSGASAELVIEETAERVRMALSAGLFRAGDLKLIMVRLSAPDESAGFTVSSQQGLDALVRNAAEAVILTDEDGRVLWVNESFLALAGLPLAAHATGRPLDHFFQWSGVEQEVLLQNVRRHGRVQAYSGTVRGANGQTTDVELSAVVMPQATSPGYGFVMRARTGDGLNAGRGNSDLTRTAENLVEMIGRVPMKDLVRDTTDVIEKMCIEAALNLTGNNRASAARVLGLSRQALYLKMHRFGIASDE